MKTVRLTQNEEKNLHQFEEVFYLNYPRLYSYAFRLLNDDKEADDVVQETFIQTWNHMNQLHDTDRLSPYLFTLLRNKCLNIIKRETVKRKYEDYYTHFEAEELYHVSFGENGEFVPIKELISQEIEKVIEKMPPKCAEVFRQKWIEGKKHREIAEALQISLTMVDKHLNRGMEIARKHLRPEMFILLMYFN
jgi:RNA polymerase sigma-70 factor (family 1)